MMEIERVMDGYNSLSDKHKEEVFDFIEFLKQKENKRIEKVSDKVFEEYDKVFKKLAKSYYSTHYDIITSYTRIEDINLVDTLKIIFEKQDKSCVAELLLPHLTFLTNKGFSEDELISLREYAKNNQLLIWDLARGVYGGE